MPLPQMNKADQTPSPDVASPAGGPRRSFLPYASAVGAAVILAVIAVSNFNGDSPDRLRPDIPKGISTGKTVYYNWRWFRCSVAVFELEPKFLADLRAGGDAALNTTAEAFWYATPVQFDDDFFWARDYEDTLKCITDEKLQLAFNTASNSDGYYLVRPSDAVALISPKAGLLLIARYD